VWMGVQKKHACSTMLTCFGITVRCSRLCIIRSAGGWLFIDIYQETIYKRMMSLLRDLM